VNCKEETKKKEQENNRMEMARLFAEAQRKEMQKRAAGR
jgi:DnaK suppressor protein